MQCTQRSDDGSPQMLQEKLPAGVAPVDAGEEVDSFIFPLCCGARPLESRSAGCGSFARPD